MAWSIVIPLIYLTMYLSQLVNQLMNAVVVPMVWVVFGSWFNGSPSPEAICNWLKTTTLRLRPAQIKWWQAYIYRLLKKTDPMKIYRLALKQFGIVLIAPNRKC